MANSKYDELYFTEQELKNAEAIRDAARNGQTDWQSAHDYVEGIRSNYGYSGGKQGDQYIATGKPAAAQAYMPSVGEAPTFSSKYNGQMDDVLGKIQNRDPFSYDYTTDPQWQSYKKEYTREGQRAAADTMGQYAAMTGGMPSTAAVTASQQAGDYYMAQMTDKIPELYQAAYRMYQDEGADLYNQLNALNGMYQNDYSKYLSDLDQYNRDRDFDYNQYIDNRNYNYQLGRDSVTDSQWEKEFGLNKDNAAYNRAVSDATNFGNWDGFKALGYSDSQVALMKAAYQQQIAQQTASKSSGGGGGRSSGGSSKPKLSAAQTLKALQDGVVNDETKAAYKYWYGQDWKGGGGYDEVASDLDAYKSSGVTNRRQLQTVIQSAMSSGLVSQEEAKKLAKKYLGSPDMI